MKGCGFRVFLNGGGGTPLDFFVCMTLGIVWAIRFRSEGVLLSMSFNIGRRGPPNRVRVRVVRIASCV